MCCEPPALNCLRFVWTFSVWRLSEGPFPERKNVYNYVESELWNLCLFVYQCYQLGYNPEGILVFILNTNWMYEHHIYYVYNFTIVYCILLPVHFNTFLRWFNAWLISRLVTLLNVTFIDNQMSFMFYIDHQPYGHDPLNITFCRLVGGFGFAK